MSESRFPEEAEPTSSPYRPPAAETRPISPTENEKPAHQRMIEGPTGIGGWLILPIIGVGLTPLQMLGTLLRDYLPIFTEGGWEAVTTPGSEAYHEMWAFTIIFEIFVHVAIAVLAVGALVLLGLRSKHTPRAFIGLYVFDAATTLLMLYTSSLVPGVEENPGGSAGIVFASLFKNALWSAYFLSSRRVRNTFVR